MIANGGQILRRPQLIVGWGLIALVVMLSLLPVEIDLSQGRDKWSHFLAYGVLMFWFGAIYTQRMRQLMIALALVGLGVGLEFLQRETGYRSYEVADMVADTIGVLLGWVVVLTPLGRIFVWLERHFLHSPP